MAKLLGVQLEPPSQAHVNTSRLRLNEAFAAKRATAVHLLRRASDRPAKLYLAEAR